jgi:hypothetical protein
LAIVLSVRWFTASDYVQALPISISEQASERALAV